MSRLDGVYIEGFKSIAHTMLKLRPLNVLIGANGSGKSNFIDAISFLRAIVQGQLQRYVSQAGGADRILHFGSRATSKLEMQVSFTETKPDMESNCLETIPMDSIRLLQATTRPVSLTKKQNK